MVELVGFELFEQGFTHIEQAGTARTAQKLAAGTAQEITADFFDIDRHLTEGLASIKQIRDACRFCDLADLCSRVDQTAARGDLGEANKFDPVVDLVLKAVYINLTRWIIRYPGDLNSKTLCLVQQSDQVTAILGAAGELLDKITVIT